MNVCLEIPISLTQLLNQKLVLLQLVLMQEYLFLHLLLELIEPLLRAHIRHTFNHAVNIYFPYEVEIKQGQGCGIFVVLFLE